MLLYFCVFRIVLSCSLFFLFCCFWLYNLRRGHFLSPLTGFLLFCGKFIVFGRENVLERKSVCFWLILFSFWCVVCLVVVDFLCFEGCFLRVLRPVSL